MSEKKFGESSGKFLGSTQKDAQKTTQKDAQISTRESDRKLAAILACIEEEPRIGRVSLAEKMGDISADGVNHQLRKLQKAGRLKRVGAAPSGHWEILDGGQK